MQQRAGTTLIFHQDLTDFCLQQNVKNIGSGGGERRLENAKATYKLNKYSDERNVILGSSHSYYGINSRHLNKNYFNLSNISQSFQEDYQILKLLGKNDRIDTVILSFSTFSSSYIMREGKESFRRYDYFFFQDEKLFFKDFADAFGKLLALGLPSPRPWYCMRLFC